MPQGIVRWFNDGMGYGFIIQNEGGKDLFVHHTGIDMDGYRSLGAGQRVKFDVVQGSKGPRAENVRVLSEPMPFLGSIRGH